MTHNRQWLLAGCLLMGLLSSASAETVFEAEVNDQIDLISWEFRQAGYVKLGQTWISELREGDDTYIEVELFDDVEYIAVGVCDNDCRDLDLVIYDERDRPIAQDISRDDVPVLSGTPDWDGIFYLEAQMPHCATRTCAFGVALYARR